MHARGIAAAVPYVNQPGMGLLAMLCVAFVCIPIETAAFGEAPALRSRTRSESDDLFIYHWQQQTGRVSRAVIQRVGADHIRRECVREMLVGQR
jgi:hypothetical protein